MRLMMEITNLVGSKPEAMMWPLRARSVDWSWDRDEKGTVDGLIGLGGFDALDWLGTCVGTIVVALDRGV